MAPLLGCIADDFTGATDLASILVRGGVRTIQTVGVPSGPAADADAVVAAVPLTVRGKGLTAVDADRHRRRCAAAGGQHEVDLLASVVQHDGRAARILQPSNRIEVIGKRGGAGHEWVRERQSQIGG